MPLRLALPVLLLVGAFAVPAPAAVAPPTAPGQGGAPYFDVRDGAKAEAVAQKRNADDVPAGQERAAKALVRSQGAQSSLDLDPTTATVRSLTDLASPLSGPSGDGLRQTALDYVRDHLTALGLTSDDLATLQLDAQDTSPDGLSVVRWRQQLGGIELFDNGLTVTLDHAGRVLTVSGSPVHDPQPNATSPDLSAEDALAALRDDLGVSGGNEEATPALVYFDVNGALRLAWRLEFRASPTALYDAVVDATSGRVLHRANLVRFAVDANVFAHYPGAPQGGSQQQVDIAGDLLTPTTTSLSGPAAVAYADLNDDDANNGGAEAVNPQTASSVFDATYALQPHAACVSTAQCSWDHTVANSWTNNKAQDAIQAFWFVNRFHDHLAAAPIDFTNTAGAFECRTTTCGSAGDDRLVVNTDDGANTAAGLPDSNHRNNANMSTPPDGGSPRMQMYLFGSSSAFRDVNGGDAAEIVFHEYTHGLSGRLVRYANGTQGLNAEQAGAMGEAWSDWYAMDFLNRGDAAPHGMGSVLVPDTPAPGEVSMGSYTDAVSNVIRSQPLDCPVGASASACPGGDTGHTGGYTYGDYGKVCSCGVEVHADGEIWAETLWDLRTQLIAHFGSVTQGSDAAEQLVTNAMTLSPPEPSFLDMRDAILLADINLGSPYQSIIWNVFAHRGMGFNAQSAGGDDPTPAEDFSLPPTGASSGTIDWAGWTAGGVITAATDTTGDQWECGPSALLDLNQNNGWSAINPHDPEALTATIRLPRTIDVTSFRADPAATCGDDPTAATKEIEVATSPDGQQFTTAYHGSFAASDAGKMNVLTPTAGTSAVRYVRVKLMSPQSAGAGTSGADWIDLSEFAVYGNGIPTAALSVPASATPTDAVALDASASRDDGPLTYDWDFDGDHTFDVTGATSAVANHVYAQEGTYKPVVRVTDAAGRTAVATATIVVSASSGSGTTDAGGTGGSTGGTNPPSGGGSTDTGGGTTTTSPGSQTTTTPPPSTTPPTATHPAPPGLVLLSGARSNGLSLRLDCTSACAGLVSLTVSRATARRLGLRSRTISRITIRADAGTATVRVPVKASVLRALRRHRLRSLHPALSASVLDQLGRRARLVGLPLVRVSRR